MKFGTSGIREIYGEDLVMSDTFGLVSSMQGSMREGSRFLVGNDTRDGCRILADGISSGLSYGGFDVNSIGLAPTPVIAFATREGNFDLGLACTASHNPPEFCGIKVFDGDGVALSEEREKTLMNSSNGVISPNMGGVFGKIQNNDYGEKYVEKIMQKFPMSGKKFRILVDCANGVGSLFTPRLLGLLGHDVFSVNSHTSPLFLGRSPEPVKANLREIAELVRRLNMDFGLVHDGDADRLVLIDGNGVVIDDYIFSYIMLQLVLKEGSGNVVISINTSSIIESLARDNQCKVWRARLGKTFIDLRKDGGIFATEPSKIIDPSWGYWEDGIYAAIKLTQYLATSGFSLSELVNSVPKRTYLQRNLVVDKYDYPSLKERSLKHFGLRGIEEVQEFDGLRLLLRDGSWILFRSSGTESKARIYVESSSEKESLALLGEGVQILSNL